MPINRKKGQYASSTLDHELFNQEVQSAQSLRKTNMFSTRRDEIREVQGFGLSI